MAGSIALPGDTLRKTKGYSTQVLSWVQAISAYNLTGDEKWKRFATSTADRYIDLQIYKNSSQPVGLMSFYNTNVYAPWWDLIDLYELTKEEKYLKAAQYGASNTIAGIRSFLPLQRIYKRFIRETVLMEYKPVVERKREISSGIPPRGERCAREASAGMACFTGRTRF